jgi:uncharacterized protein YbaR (Trm112 family)
MDDNIQKIATNKRIQWALCPHCKKDHLKYMDADEPWNMEYLQCPNCDSTYNIFDTKLLDAVE